MTNKLKIFPYYLLILFCLASAALGTQQAGAFLDLGIGARAMGMGGAFGAIADDAFAFYWNPAGISLLGKREIGMMYTSLFGLTESHSISFVQPIGPEAALSLGWIRLSVDDIPRYEPFPEGAEKIEDRIRFAEKGPKGYFSDREDALFFSFGKMNRFNLDLGWQYFVLPIEVPFGVNLKWIHYSLGDTSATGIGFDLGAMVRFGADDLFAQDFLGDVSFGLVFQDIANTAVVWDTRHQDVISHSIRFSFAYLQPLQPLRSRTYISAEKDGEEFKAGLEYWFDDRVALRGGFNQGDFCAGAGFALRCFQVNYAFVAQELGAVHRISGRLKF